MKLLKQLYGIHSMSGQEGAMRKFIKRHLRGMAGVTVQQVNGNIYITKGVAESYPCLAAHLDQVQTMHSADFRVLDISGKLFGFSAENRRLEGLGADDKNGIWIALKALERMDVLKVALFKEEEIGCGGSRVADMRFFEDCRFVIQADRRNGGDLITDICGPICSDEFKAAVMPVAERFGYRECGGMMTDVEELVNKGLGLSCLNISCGYYDPHTDHEYTVVAELQNALEFVCALVEGLGERQWSFEGGWGYDYREEVYVPRFCDYGNEEQFIDDFIYWNAMMDPEELYPYIQAEWEDTLGKTEQEFYDICKAL